MRKDGLGKFYDRLTPLERFRLVVEAEARGDEEECRRLVESCLRKTYTMHDAAYEQRMRASEEVTITVCLDLAPRLAKLQMLVAFSNVLAFLHNSCLNDVHMAYLYGSATGARRAWKAAGQEGDPPELEENLETKHTLDGMTSRAKGEPSEFITLVGRLKQDLLEETRAICGAFSNFSRDEVGIEPEKLMKVWFEPILPEIEKLEQIPDDPEVDTEKLKEYEAILKQIWSKLIALS
jgi:hypothetical protein